MLESGSFVPGDCIGKGNGEDRRHGLTNKIAALSARAWTPQQAKAAPFRPSLIIAITTATQLPASTLTSANNTPPQPPHHSPRVALAYDEAHFASSLGCSYHHCVCPIVMV